MKVKRDLNIDRYRGLLVILMIIFGLLTSFNSFGALHNAAEHAPDTFPKTIEEIEYQRENHPIYVSPNLAIADLSPGPFFLMIAFTLLPSYNRKVKKYGKSKAIKMLTERYISLIGIGSCTYTICAFLYEYTFHVLSYGLVVLTTFVILLLLGYLFLLALKSKSNLKEQIKEITKYTILFMGIYTIILNVINTILVILGYTENFFGYWGVLEHIGFAGLIVLFIIKKLKNNSSKERLICGILILIIYTIFHETTLPTLANNTLVNNNMRIIDLFPDGGIIGGIGYASMLLIFTYIMDMYKTNKKKYYISFLIIAILHTISYIYVAYNFIPWDSSLTFLSSGISKHLTVSKESISPTYIIIDMLATLVVFEQICLLKKFKPKFDLLNILGRNGILLFILEFILIQTLGFITKDIPLAIAILESIVIFSILIFIANELYKKDIIIKV